MGIRDKSKVTTVRRRVACLAAVLARSAALAYMVSICDEVEARGGELHTFTYFDMYDETPMKVRTAERAAPGAILQSGHRGDVLGEDCSPQKLLHIQTVSSLLVVVGNVMFDFSFVIPQWLLCLASTSAECYIRALMFCRHASKAVAARFSRRRRLCSTDGGKAIARAERGLSALSPGGSTLNINCEAHIAATM